MGMFHIRTLACVFGLRAYRADPHRKCGDMSRLPSTIPSPGHRARRLSRVLCYEHLLLDTHPPTHPPTHPLTYTLSHSVTSLTKSLTYSLTHRATLRARAQEGRFACHARHSAPMFAQGHG